MTLAGRFDRLQRGNLVASKRLTGIAIAAFAAPFFLLGAAGVRINSSPSLPLGFYTETSDKGARLIEFCPPDRTAASWRAEGTDQPEIARTAVARS